MSTHDWVASAACSGLDVSLFFPDQGGRVDPGVLKICRACPVQRECLKAAIVEEDGWERYGVRGGLSANQRRGMYAWNMVN